MNTINRTPTKEIYKSNTLAVEIIGDLKLELSALPNGDYILDITNGGETINVSRHRDISLFQMGRIFEREVAAYSDIIKDQ